jgi:tRNA A-37 threonylcarbamoyl transferase component Bud32
MREIKDTPFARVRIGYDGRVHKTFLGKNAKERFQNEVRVLRHLEERGCDFVPRLLEVHEDELQIVTTNCGMRVDVLSEKRMKKIFAELEKFGVRHDDPFKRNVTYEFATLLEESSKEASPETAPPKEESKDEKA